VLSQFAKRLKTCRQRYEAFVLAGKKEGHRQEFHRGGKDGRVLADDRFLEQVLGKRIQPTPEVSLDEIMTYVSAEYGVEEEELRGPSRNRVVCEARAVIGWLSWRLESSSITDVAIYFQRDSSTFSRHIGKIDAKAKNSDKLRDRLNGYINALMHA
jgi:putative transposase